MSTVQEGFCPIEEALEELRQGRMIILVDDEYRENEGDLVIAAEKVTPDAINFMVRNGCGILGLAMSSEICDRLDLEPLRLAATLLQGVELGLRTAHVGLGLVQCCLLLREAGGRSSRLQLVELCLGRS